MLVVEDLAASYGKGMVLQQFSAQFRQGRLTALVGANGCGKSTLLKAIMGFLPVTRGSIRIGDHAVSALGRRALARRIAYLPQENHCPDYFTLGELVRLGGYARYPLLGGPSDKDRQLFHAALETVGLVDMAHRPVNSLSGGQRQRAWLAMVLAQDAEVVLMDEPVNHLDIKYQYAVLELVRTLTLQHGKTIIAVLHDLNLAAAFADEVVMLRDGRVAAAGSVAETITASTVAHVFDLQADVFRRNGRLVCLPQVAAQ